MPVDLSQYVSNLEQNVYTIYNLPEEVIAVIFAYVSRSSKGFRENLRELLEKEEVIARQSGNQLLLSETAKKFHERWVVGYGHSSVAEHAVAHIGVERISRLASAELELANPFNSFTEYSQRYQRPQRNHFYIPEELRQDEELLQSYIAFNHEAYDAYEFLLEGLIRFLKKTEAPGDKESERAYHSRIEKAAFEDARYVLTLGTLTNLGMTGNGRSLRDTLVALLSSSYRECIDLAKALEKEVSRVLPTLLRHVSASPYLIRNRQILTAWGERVLTAAELDHTPPLPVNTLIEDYETALNRLVTALLFTGGSRPSQEVQQAVERAPLEEKEGLLDETLSHLTLYDNPHPAFEQVRLSLQLQVSEANWHQLLRHNRRTHFIFQAPHVSGGATIPPHIREAGLAENMEAFIHRAECIYVQIAERHPAAAAYCVTNAHRREVAASLSLWELYHLVNLRTSTEAQWDIRQTFDEVYRHLQASHPVLARYAKRR